MSQYSVEGNIDALPLLVGTGTRIMVDWARLFVSVSLLTSARVLQFKNMDRVVLNALNTFQPSSLARTSMESASSLVGVL